MKKALGILSLLLITVAFAQAQTAVPAQVKAAYDQQFPNIEANDWELEDGIWEVDFTHKGKEVEAKFDAAGNWLGTEREIAVSDFPANLKSKILATWPNAIITEVEIVEQPGNSTYELELKNGTEEVEVLIDDKGVILGSQVEDRDDD